MPIGDIRKRLCNGSVIFEWTIPKFFSTAEERTSLYSPQFKHLKTFWNLEIVTDSSCDSDWIEIALRRCTTTSLKSVWCTIGIETAEGIEERILCAKWMQGLHDYSSDVVTTTLKSDDMKCRSELASKHGILTIICCLTDDPPSTVGHNSVFPETKTEDLTDKGAKGETLTKLTTKGQKFVSCATQREDLTDDDAREDIRTRPGTRGGAIQQKHFKDLLLEGQDHDVTLKVKDREFGAHKCVLRARSPVFAAMFAHNMKEAECGDVTIEDCDPNAFGEFLEYVYTGKVDNLTPRSSLGLYYAGDKYDFPDMKEMCVEFLKTNEPLAGLPQKTYGSCFCVGKNGMFYN